MSGFYGGVPAACPFPRSAELTSVRLTENDHVELAGSDTWYPAWSQDGKCYSPFMDGDGAQGAFDQGYQGEYNLETFRAQKGTKAMGFGIITGTHPKDLVVDVSRKVIATCAPWNARYGTTVLAHEGVIYYGSSYRQLVPMQGMWDYHLLMPFAGFHISQDGGNTFTAREGSLFPEAEYPCTKMGECHFVDFGRNMQHSPDGKAYLLGHGHADDNLAPPEGNPNWMWGDAIYLARVRPSVANINDASRYEYWTGKGWSNDFHEMKPLLQWHNRMGGVTVSYHAGMKKYLMCVTCGRDYYGAYDSYFLEADQVTGPWRIVDYWTKFGAQGYFLNIPTRFMAATRSADGWRMWLVYSGPFRNVPADPPGSRYGFNLREIVFLS